MNRDELMHLMLDLQADLESGAALSPEARAQLQRLHDDIAIALQNDALAEAKGLSAPPRPDPEDSLARRAQELDAQISAEHPYLTETLRNAADLLGKMGI